MHWAFLYLQYCHINPFACLGFIASSSTCCLLSLTWCIVLCCCLDIGIISVFHHLSHSRLWVYTHMLWRCFDLLKLYICVESWQPWLDLCILLLVAAFGLHLNLVHSDLIWCMLHPWTLHCIHLCWAFLILVATGSILAVHWTVASLCFPLFL